ncbi:MBL fold metallo-hydrolase [Gluconobacter sp. OJB]|uniref:MBL fold metallo-hydrolase n=1 Tax=Gluconobacter sp. OJB TaxID=3145196 RepID=UPI0031F8F479
MIREVSNKDISLPSLFVTEAGDLPFMQGVEVRSYLIKTDKGFTAIYNSPGLSKDKNAIVELGRPSALLMSHWHEAMYKAPELGIAAYVAAADLSQTKASMSGAVDLATYLSSDNTIEIISTPGHTAGFSMFLWTCGNHRVLFSGDMIWSHHNRWEAVVLDESNRQKYISSLETIAGLDFDVLVPWVSMRGEQYPILSDRPSARNKILRIIERLKGGEVT